MIDEACTAELCEATPQCPVCHLTKPPRGRSVAVEAANGMCGYDCPGYMKEPLSGHLWPGELRRYREEEACCVCGHVEEAHAVSSGRAGYCGVDGCRCDEFAQRSRE